jgi:hypothetical protein
MRAQRLLAFSVAAVAIALILIRERWRIGGEPPDGSTASAETRPDAASARVARFDASMADEQRAVPGSSNDFADTPPRKFQRRLMFDCGDVRIFIRIGEGEAALLRDGSLTGHWIPLAFDGSAWRGRYANEGLAFRPDDAAATFVLGDETLKDCAATRDRAALAEVSGGVFLQAFGDDPRWTLEITDDELTLTTDGARRARVPLRAPIDDGGRMTFRSVVGTQEITATLDRIRCYDAASGETFELTAAVSFDRAWYYGCARRIRYR